MLISIDHGNKQVKTIHHAPFTSGLTNTVKRPPRDPGRALLHLSKRGCIDWFRAKMPEFLGRSRSFG